jgi:nucleoside 2-deoxyribosyltransferase
MNMKIYLAGPYGFTEIMRKGIEDLRVLLRKKGEVINPFEHSTQHTQNISQIETQITTNQLTQPLQNVRNTLAKINLEIGQKNVDLITSADVIFAVLDGSDVDSGTAAEIGFGYAKGKKIYGYRSDFRYSGDNFGSVVNLQVEFFIRASGGTIFRSLMEVEKWIKTP